MAKFLINVYSGLATSATDQTVTMAPNDFNSTTVPGGSVLVITGITAMCVDSTAGRELTVWLVESGGSIGDSNGVVRSFALPPKQPRAVFGAASILNGFVMTTGMELHLKATTANKIQVNITGVWDTDGGGQLDI